MGIVSTEYYSCDGTTVGFKIKIGGEYLKTKNNRDRLFTNLEFAKAIAYNNGASSGRDFDIDLYFVGNIISFNDLQRVSHGKFEFFANNQNGELIRFVIEETFITEFNNFGYICFDRGDKERTEREVGVQRAKVLRRILLDSIEKLSTKYGVVEEVFEYDKEIQIKFWKTTARLNIITNAGLMDLNQWRKNVEDENPEYSRCFPFIKNMDKFVTFYTYIDKELYEPSKKNLNSGIAKSFRELMMEDLVDNWNTYNKNPDEKCKSIPTFHAVFYKINNKILS